MSAAMTAVPTKYFIFYNYTNFFGTAVIAALINSSEAVKLVSERHHHHHGGSSWEKDFVQIGLRANNDMLSEID
jgi:hypothetical protein